MAASPVIVVSLITHITARIHTPHTFISTCTHTHTYIKSLANQCRLDQPALDATAFIKDGERHSCSFSALKMVSI